MRDANLSIGESKSLVYEKKNRGNSNQNDEKEKSKEVNIPNLSRSVISPPPPTIGGEKIISFYVDERTSLKDLLIELGRIAEVDIDIDPKVSGKVIINAKNRPFKEILDRISTQARLRYSYKNKVLYFEPNYPYMKNYFVDFLLDSKLWDELSAGIDNIFNANAALNPDAKDSNVIVNKNSGIVTIFATEPEHQAVQNFLDDIIRQGSSQVLIEARIFEVSLYDNFKYGIDWAKGDFIFGGGNASEGYKAPSASGIVGNGLFASNPAVKIFGSNIAGSIGMLQQFGVARSISSPRINAMNNMPATLKFNDKLVYFRVEITNNNTTSNGASNTLSTLTSNKLEEDQGTQISITPTINNKTQEITMLIEPKITRKTGEVLDPASPEGFSNYVPIMNERTLNTTVKIKSGNTIVIGGLMKNSSANSDAGVPFLSKLPLIGWLFKLDSKADDVVETVIFLKATIVSPDALVIKEDRNLDKIDPSLRSIFP